MRYTETVYYVHIVHHTNYTGAFILLHAYDIVHGAGRTTNFVADERAAVNVCSRRITQRLSGCFAREVRLRNSPVVWANLYCYNVNYFLIIKIAQLTTIF